MSNNDHEERDCVKRAQSGDSEAFEALYAIYIQPLFRFIFSKVGNRTEAEDLTQVTFTKMLQSLGSFQFQSSFKTWLYRIAVNTVIDYWRDHYKHRTVSLENFLEILPLEERTFDEEAQDQKEQKVSQILSGLNKEQRQVLELRFLKGYSIKETAEALLLSESNVKVIQHRALKKAATNFSYEQCQNVTL